MIFLYILLASTIFRNSYTAVIDGYKTYKDYRLYKVQGNYQVMLDFMEKSLELFDSPFSDIRGSEVHLMIAPESVKLFEDTAQLMGLITKVEIEDYSQIINSEKAGYQADQSFSWTAYHDVDAIHHYLENASKSNPEWTELITVGQSHQGRKLLGIRINTPSETKEGKPVVFIESGIHAREWITPAATTYFINQLLTSSDPKVTNLRDSFDWRIVPTVNPDGYQYSFVSDRLWRKTRAKSSLFCTGTDANRNWDYNWMKHGSSNNPCNYQTFAGSKPFSEIETRTLSQYLAGIENLLAYVAFHSDAQMLLVPYSDTTQHTANYDDLIRIGNTSLEYGAKVNGEQYRGPATAAEILYEVSGGSMDWVRHELGTPLVYTFELRGTYFHWPPERIYEQGDEYTQMMVGLFDEAKNLGYY